MSDLILHHYPESPYAEKIRRLMGMKELAWRSVIIPMIMPKPDLTALTGGYRKTPVLQIGADIYCDTDLIARVIDARHPEPPLFPGNTESLSLMLGPWQNELFWLCVRTVGAVAPVFPPGFLEDRATMLEVPLTMDRMVSEIAVQREQLRSKLELLDGHLRRHSFILGDEPCLADLALFHPVYVLKIVAQTAERLHPFHAIRGWMDKIEAFGHGTPSEMPGEDAVQIAKAATSTAEEAVDPKEPNGLKPGDSVEVVHEDFGRDPVAGDLVFSNAQEIAIRRSDERAGEVVVHFPREHYQVRVV